QTSIFPLARVKSIVIQSGNGNDRIFVENTVAGIPVTIDAGDGNDTITVGGPLNNLDNIQATLTINGGGGSDRLNLNDQGNAAAATPYTIRNSSCSRSNSATINYSNLENLIFSGGSGTNPISVEGTAAAMPLTINAGAGNDTIRLGNASNKLDDIFGTMLINGQAGTDTLQIQDQGSTTARGFTLTANSLTR